MFCSKSRKNYFPLPVSSRIDISFIGNLRSPHCWKYYFLYIWSEYNSSREIKTKTTVISNHTPLQKHSQALRSKALADSHRNAMLSQRLHTRHWIESECRLCRESHHREKTHFYVNTNPTYLPLLWKCSFIKTTWGKRKTKKNIFSWQ